MKCWWARNLAKRAGAIVIQELLEGMEISLHAICDGTDGAIFPDGAGP